MLSITWLPLAGEFLVWVNGTGAPENFIDILLNRAHAGGFLLSYKLIVCGKLFVGSSTASFAYFISGIKLNEFLF